MLYRLKKQVKAMAKGQLRVVVWREHKLIYVRMPKAGNSSICASIEGGQLQRMRYQQLASLEDNWTTFSFVRNPWARLVSAYADKVSNTASPSRLNEQGAYQGFENMGIPVRAGMSFEDFCDVVCATPDHRMDKHLQSQSHTLIRNNKPVVSYLGRVEAMTADWSALMTKVGLRAELLHLNSTRVKSEHYSQFYTSDSLIQKVADRYADDIKYFNCQFEKP